MARIYSEDELKVKEQKALERVKAIQEQIKKAKKAKKEQYERDILDAVYKLADIKKWDREKLPEQLNKICEQHAQNKERQQPTNQRINIVQSNAKS